MDEVEREKLEVLLNYWMEHNEEHGEEFKEWAEKAKSLGEIAYQGLLEAAEQMNKTNESLLKVLQAVKDKKP